MKIDYDSNTENKRNWKLGDVIQDIDGDFYLVSGVTSEDEIFYTLIDLEGGSSLGCANTISELQQAYCDNGDMILDGTFKYMDDDQ